MKRHTSASSLPKNQTYEGTHSSHGEGARHPPRNKVTARPLMANMPRYSARKNNAYLNPEYSVRCPAMISDSASGMSKGERFDSASVAIRKITKPAKPQGVNTFQCGTRPNR